MTPSNSTQPKPVFAYTCGGTGGHIYPAIALAQELQGDAEAVFIGSHDREDVRIVPRYGFKLCPISASNRNPFVILKGFFQARSYLKSTQSRCLIATGGYLTFPVILAAWTLSLPIFLLEQNAVLGQVNRRLARLVSAIFVSFENTLNDLPMGRGACLGNPVRKSYAPDAVVTDLAAQLTSDKVLLVFGGSQGARALNNWIASAATALVASGWEIVHITGTADYQAMQSLSATQPQWHVLDYAEDMAQLYAAASVVVSRAGATTIAELMTYQKPAILVPYPYAKEDHQRANAQAFVSQGGGQVCEESCLDTALLLDSLETLVARSKHQTRLPEGNARELIAQAIRDSL